MHGIRKQMTMNNKDVRILADRDRVWAELREYAKVMADLSNRPPSNEYEVGCLKLAASVVYLELSWRYRESTKELTPDEPDLLEDALEACKGLIEVQGLIEEGSIVFAKDVAPIVHHLIEEARAVLSRAKAD